MPYQGITRLPLPVKRKDGEPSYRGGVFTARLERSAPRTTKVRPRGVVGADPGEIRIREAAARKKAFDRECYAVGTNCDYSDLDEVDAQEMEELIFEMEQFEDGSSRTPTCGEKDGRKKSFAARMMSRAE